MLQNAIHISLLELMGRRPDTKPNDVWAYASLIENQGEYWAYEHLDGKWITYRVTFDGKADV